MCGICGIVYPDRHHNVDKRELLIMRDVLTHRGPDDAGHYLGTRDRVWGHVVWQSLDLSDRGHMPMSTPTAVTGLFIMVRFTIFGSCAQCLKSEDTHFRSNTDTEVLLYLYAAQGPAMLGSAQWHVCFRHLG